MKRAFLLGMLLLLSCSHPKIEIEKDVLVERAPVNDIPPPPPWLESRPGATECPDDMVLITGRHYCIDKYEAPNKKGTKPFAAQSAFQAVDYCRGIGKDLCTQNEWQTACAGPKGKIEPYGNAYKRGTCNDDKNGWVPVPWGTMGTPAWDKFCKEQYKGEASGSRAACISDYGVYDMTGNVAEWVIEPKSPHGYVVKGGYWYGVLQGQPSCGFVNPAHAPGFNSYEFGFRCCKEADYAKDSNKPQ